MKLEHRGRLVGYLVRFGLAVPDYGIMVSTATRLVSGFESDPQLALDRALFVREHGIDSIRSDDRELFEKIGRAHV